MRDSIIDLRRGIYRRIYAGFIWGRRINSVSLEAEAWFWRLNAIADDYGNLPADEERICAETRGPRSMSAREVAALCAQLERANLIRCYEADGDRYYHILGFEELQPSPKNGRRIRKCPPHPEMESGGIRVNPGESGGIRVNPGESGGIRVNPGESGGDGANPLPLIPIPIPIPIPTPIPNTNPILVSAPPQTAGAPPAATAPESQPQKPKRPTILWTPQGWAGISDEDKARWKSAYPACDIDRQLAAMEAWLRANPKKAKKSNWGRFIVNWLSKSQDRGGDERSANGRPNQYQRGTSGSTQAGAGRLPTAAQVQAAREFDERAMRLPIVVAGGDRGKAGQIPTNGTVGRGEVPAPSS